MKDINKQIRIEELTIQSLTKRLESEPFKSKAPESAKEYARQMIKESQERLAKLRTLNTNINS